MAFKKITEQASNYRHLEKMAIGELLANINKEDQVVPAAVAKAIPQIEKLVEVISDKMLMGGRLFYIGAGTSGRLQECAERRRPTARHPPAPTGARSPACRL